MESKLSYPVCDALGLAGIGGTGLFNQCGDLLYPRAIHPAHWW